MLDLGRPAPSGGRSLPQLDALRGVAILAVFVQHLGDRYSSVVERSIEASLPSALIPWALTIVHHAWWGVDLFFVLSGFSLALGPLRASSSAGSVSSFFVRRAARILPAFYVALLVHLVAHPSVLDMPRLAASMAVHLALLQGYLAPGGIVLIGAAWSLTTEAHFYALFPWIMRLGKGDRWGIVRLGLLCAAVWLVRGALHAVFLEPSPYGGLLAASQRHWIISRLDQFVLGIVAAWIHLKVERSGRAKVIGRWAPASLLVSIVSLVIAFRLEGALYLEPGGSYPYALLSLSTAALVLSAVLCRDRMIGVIAPRPLQALGVVSYGVFLYHQLCLGIADRTPALPPSWSGLVRTGSLGLLLSFVVGLASWVLVERPVMRWAARSGRRREILDFNSST